ncbi:MAG: hypothetical protein KF724_06820 [Phycisphaeraceae bacterium]|nr:hypothetical protein [Phycisphaeraceae bacterium]
MRGAREHRRAPVTALADRRTRLSSSVLGAALSAVLSGTTVGGAALQDLDLSSAPSRPRWPVPGAASLLADQLAREIESLRRTSATSDGQALLVLECGIALRMAASELLVRGDGHTSPDDRVVVAGFRLAEARGDFDTFLRSLPTLGPDDDTHQALERFRDSALGSLRASAVSELPLTTQALLLGLAPALKAASLPPLHDHWPMLTEVGAGEREARPASVDDAVSSSWSSKLTDALAAHPPSAEIAEALGEVATSLSLVEQWPDLASRIAPLGAALVAVPEIAQRIEGVPWLPPTLRQAFSRRMVSAIRASAIAESRESALAALAHARAFERAISTADALIRPRGSNAGRGPVDPTRLLKALQALADPNSERVADASERLRMVGDLLATMVEARRLEEREVSRQVRVMRRQLAREALLGEDPVMRQVESLANAATSTTDPAIITLLESQRRRLRSIALLDDTDAAISEIEARSISHGPGLSTRLRGWFGQLGDPTRSESARRQLTVFLDQWRGVREHEVERLLRRGDASTMALTAGRMNELLGEIDRRRKAWAAGWSDGAPEQAWSHVQDLLRLLDLMDDVAALARTEANPRLIGRWGGWDDIGGIPGSTDAMSGRIAVAIEALARKNDRALADALRVIDAESPAWRLRAALLRRLAPALVELPDGLSGALGRVGGVPAPGAFMGDRSIELASLARAARERLTAERQRDTEQVDALDAFMREMTLQLRRSLDP